MRHIAVKVVKDSGVIIEKYDFDSYHFHDKFLLLETHNEDNSKTTKPINLDMVVEYRMYKDREE